MSEKRFVWDKDLDRNRTITDTKTNRVYDKYSWEELEDVLNELNDENEQLRQTVQHLEEECGARENDITKLREMNEQLREINKTIGDDLHNCRINKNIISEKLKLWQDTLAEYDIYTIKDLEKIK